MYKSGNASTQIDYIMFRKRMHKLVTDVMVIPGGGGCSAAPASGMQHADLPKATKDKTQVLFSSESEEA